MLTCVWTTLGGVRVAATKQGHYGLHHASFAEGLIKTFLIDELFVMFGCSLSLSCYVTPAIAFWAWHLSRRWRQPRKQRWTLATWPKFLVQPSLGIAAWKLSRRKSWKRWDQNCLSILNFKNGVKECLFLRWVCRRQRWRSWLGSTATTGTLSSARMKERTCTGTAGMLTVIDYFVKMSFRFLSPNTPDILAASIFR